MDRVASFGQIHFGAADLGDARRVQRLVDVADQVAGHPRDAFPKKFHDPADLKGFYRLMASPAVTHASVLAAHRAHTVRRMQAQTGVVLILHDTTVLDYSGLTAISELGQVGDGHGRGYYAHNSLAVAADTRVVLGLANQILHTRRRVPRGEKKSVRRRHPDRESRLWKRASADIPAAPPGQRWVDVADRGADITEFLDYEEAAGKQYVVRSQHNRVLVQEPHAQPEPTKPAKLHEHARRWPAQGQRTVRVQARPGQAARQATVSVSWQAVTLRPPRQPRGDERGAPLAVWTVRVWEATPPPGVEGLEWLLLTNVPVTHLADAFERVDWYHLRWLIEEYHKAMKTGCDIEAMQFAYRARLEPAIALLSVIALTLLHLRDQCRNPQAAQQRACETLPRVWIEVLSSWRHGVVQPDWTLRDFYYALARLGGHQNRKHDHPPGWLVLWRGWLDLQAMLEGAAAMRAINCGQT